MKIYVAGPMRGYPEFNFPAFDAAAALLRGMGHEVFSPAERDRGTGFDETKNSLDGFDLHAAMRADLDYIVNQSDAIALLPGWEKSSGANIEKTVAEATGKTVYWIVGDEVTAWNPKPPETILEEAQRLVYGNRQADYGHPIEDFTRTGKMWGAILGTADVSPDRVALCMVALKVSRECHRPKRDNIVDGAGYFAALALVREKQEVGGV